MRIQSMSCFQSQSIPQSRIDLSEQKYQILAIYTVISSCFLSAIMLWLIEMLKKNITKFFNSRVKGSLPIIDLAPYAQQKGDWQQTAFEIRKACKEIGFFYIVNHGVSPSLQSSIFSSAKQFFAQPLCHKKQMHIEKSGLSWKGYFQYGFEYTSAKQDLKEGIWYGRELGEDHPGVKNSLPFHGKNPFPNGLPKFKKDVLLWLAQMERVGGLLSMALADSLALDRRFFVDGMCRDHLGTLGIMHYPAQAEISEDQWGVGTHSDYGFLTMLMFDKPRLEAQDVNGNWLEIQAVPGAFVVNIGDILQVMTKGLYKSTPHRAQNCSKDSRIALPYFYDINWCTPIQPLDIIVSSEQQRIMEKTKAYKRWDNAALHQTDGIFGHYVIRKLMKAFPSSLQNQFAAAVSS